MAFPIWEAISVVIVLVVEKILVGRAVVCPMTMGNRQGLSKRPGQTENNTGNDTRGGRRDNDPVNGLPPGGSQTVRRVLALLGHSSDGVSRHTGNRRKNHDCQHQRSRQHRVAHLPVEHRLDGGYSTVRPTHP